MDFFKAGEECALKNSVTKTIVIGLQGKYPILSNVMTLLWNTLAKVNYLGWCVTIRFELNFNTYVWGNNNTVKRKTKKRTNSKFNTTISAPVLYCMVVKPTH